MFSPIARPLSAAAPIPPDDARRSSRFASGPAGGFTLIEIMVVLAILALLASVLISGVTKSLNNARVSTTHIFVDQTLHTALTTYSIQLGGYPATEEGLAALLKAPNDKADRWQGPYVEGGKIPLDPWGHEYQYKSPGEHNKDGYDLWSWAPMARPEQPTTSAIGRAPGASGFTLLEVVLVLALLALLGTLTIGVSSKLLQDQATSPDDVFWKACQASRKAALESGHEVRLSFDPKAKAFVCDDGITPATLPVPKAAPDLTVDFHDNQTAANLVLIAGTAVETQPIPYVTFYADGTCSPFHVQFRAKGGAHIVSIDPWTCAPILPAKPAATGS